MIGSFDSLGCPTISIGISGPLTKPVSISGLVDTGFSGFVSIPMVQAFPIGLVLSGTTSVVLADSSVQHRLTCLGMVHFEGDNQIDLIMIESQGDQVLIGMRFLEVFGLELKVDPTNNLVEIVKVQPSNPPPASTS